MRPLAQRKTTLAHPHHTHTRVHRRANDHKAKSNCYKTHLGGTGPSAGRLSLATQLTLAFSVNYPPALSRRDLNMRCIRGIEVKKPPFYKNPPCLSQNFSAEGRIFFGTLNVLKSSKIMFFADFFMIIFGIWSFNKKPPLFVPNFFSAEGRKKFETLNVMKS